jgi:signal transduction histidine kinase
MEAVMTTHESDILSLLNNKIDDETFAELEKRISFLSHELKRPLASAILSLHTVKDGYVGDLSESQQKLVTSVAEDLDRMTETIKELLDDPRKKGVK